METKVPGSTPSKPVARRVLRALLLYLLLPLCLLLALLTGSLFLYCKLRPEQVAAMVQDRLCDSTGLPWRIQGAIYPVLTPLPGIEATDVLILAASVEQGLLCNLDRPLVHAKNLQIYLDPASLLEFNPRLRLMALDSPAVNLSYDENHQPLWLPLGNPKEDENRPLVFEHMHVSPVSEPGRNSTGGASLLPDKPLPGTVRAKAPSLKATPGESDNLQVLADFLLDMPDSALPPMVIHNGSLRSYTETGEILLSFNNVEAKLTPSALTGNLVLAAVFSLPGADLEARFSLSATLGRDGLPARGQVSGDIGMTPPGSRTVTGSFASGFVWQNDGKTVLLPDFRMVAEGDALTANLRAELSKFSCTGLVQLHKLSLPRWFGFGRSLPPGLQQPMDSLVGEFDLFLDSHAAEAWNLRGVVGHMAVSGYVGVKEFSEPVVVVDLDVGNANLDLIFPFLAKVGRYVPDPLAPVFDHPQLAPYPEDPSAPPPVPDGTDVGVSYDVKVRVAHPRVHDVDAGPLEVLVFPVTVKGIDKTRVAFDKVSVIQGTVEGRLDIDEDSIFMHYGVAGLELRLLPENADNTVRIAGRLTGECDIDMPMLADGSLAEFWKLNVNAFIANCDITGRYEKSPWQLFAGKASATGSGTIYSILEKGVRIEGLWNIAAQSIKTSWNPGGKEAVSGNFKGGLFWPPIEHNPRRSRKDQTVIEKKGVERVAGSLNLNGSLVSPLGSLRVPVKGQMQGDLNWLIYDEKISLDNIRFQGFGSYSEGLARIDFSGKEILFTAESSFKMNPGELLRDWKLMPPEPLHVPKVLTGKTSISTSSSTVIFDKLKVEADGAPISGEITWQATAGAEKDKAAKNPDPGLWTFRLTAEHLDIDNYFPSAPKGKPAAMPSQEPWNLKPFRDASLDIQLLLRTARYRDLTLSQTKVTGTLQRDRFSVHADIGKFYDGTATLLVQGTVVPDKSQITLRKGLFQMQHVALGKMLYDYTKERHYAGTADLVVDVAGTLACNADIPAKLTGIWSMNIKDGLYPAFLTNESSQLRNTFSLASASGAMNKGVITSDNFRLSGPMVDMSGSGKLNLNTSEMDIGISVTFAKVPTVPVRFHGSTDAPRMQVRGVNMVVETVQAAGVTVFTLVKNVLELPAHAVRGINSLMEKDEKK